MMLVNHLVLLLSLAGLAHYCLALFAARRFFSEPTDDQQGNGSAGGLELPPVSILKPVSGASSETYENLASFCRQAYPRFEVVFGIQAGSTASIPVIERLARDFPEAEIRYTHCDRRLGANPKVNNLATAYESAKHDLLVLSDGDVRVGGDYLVEITQPFRDKRVGVVTCLYRSIAKGATATFEALGVSTEFLPNVLVSRQLEGMTFALGATIAIKRQVLQSIGGFAAVADALEDDFQLGRLASLAGYKIVLSRYIVDHDMGAETWRDLVHHQTRWTRGTRFARPLGYLGLIFTFGTIWSALYLLASGGSAVGWLLFGTVWPVRYLMAWLIGVRHLGDSIARRWLILVPLRDLMSFAFWLYGFAGDTIVWRGKRMRLLRGGKVGEAAS